MKTEFKSLPGKSLKRAHWLDDEDYNDEYPLSDDDDSGDSDNQIVTQLCDSHSSFPDPPPPPLPLVPLSPEEYALGSDGWLENGATYPVLVHICLQGGTDQVIHMDWRKMSYSPYMRSVFKKGWRELELLPVWNWPVDDPEAVANVLWMIDTGAERCHGASPEMLVRMARVAAIRKGIPGQCTQFVRVDDPELQGRTPLWGWRKPGYTPVLYTNEKLETYKRTGELETVCAEPVSTVDIGKFHIISKHDPVVSPLTNPRVRMFTGDICDVDRLGVAMEECSIVYHLCGDTQWWDKNNAEQRRVNVEGTRTAFQLACLQGVTSFVHVSTIDVLGATPPQSSLSGPAPPDFQYSYHNIGYNYADTKREAEKVLEDALKERLDRPRVYIIRPGSVIGPWDVTKQYGRLFTEIRNGIMGFPAGGSHWCHADDVAYDIANAPLFIRGGNSQQTVVHAYTTTGGYSATYKEVFTWIARSMFTAGGVRCAMSVFDPPVIATLLLVFYGWFCQFVSNWITHTPPEMNPGMAWYMSQRTEFISPDQQRYTQQRVIDAIEDSRKWYAERGMI